MLDFLRICSEEVVKNKKCSLNIFPDFIMKKSSDLMIKGGDFYAVWDEDNQRWSQDEDTLIDLIDREMSAYAKTEELEGKYARINVKYMRSSRSGSIDQWHKYCQKQSRDSYHMLDETIIFSNTEPNKKDYSSKHLNYPLEKGDYPAWEKIISTLYTEEERHKIEWAIGSIVDGGSKKLQKFLVFYGAAGTGKSTILNIIQQLFDGYYAVFDAKSLGNPNSQFALEPFKSNPLVGIQHDGDLSRIEDNTRLNSLVSHEEMTINEKHKGLYTNAFKAFLFMGTNKPVKITDSRSGLMRRLIDVRPSGKKLSSAEYRKYTKQIKFELGAIAYHCMEVYQEDPEYYDDYQPQDMMGASNDFYNYIVDNYRIFIKEDEVTLKAAWSLYKEYVEDAKVAYPMNRRVFKEELKNYFWECDGNTFRRFKRELVEHKHADRNRASRNEADSGWINFKEQHSLLDDILSDSPAQYATDEGNPRKAWKNVRGRLSDLDTNKLHWVKLNDPAHIVIDFDIKDADGNKSYEKNLEAANKWPATYAELSKSGAGIHLHYLYSGDPTKLSRIYEPDIEVKVYLGDSSLRRIVTKCNDIPIATIHSGLPLKEEGKVIDTNVIQSEKGLRTTIKRCLAKEIHSSTASNVDWIYKVLNKAYESGMKYDVSDMENAVIAFASGSTHQKDKCLDQVCDMHFKSEEPSEAVKDSGEAPIVFFDIEIFPNLFVICWKFAGEDRPVVSMVNPKGKDVEDLLKFRLVGFNNRKYDNHIIYAAMMGYSVEALYQLSQRIINEHTGYLGGAYNISYTDIYDYAAKKQSLKKWEIELGIHHQELGLSWDEPVAEELWEKVADYCKNDVVATEAVWNATQGDFTARCILAELAGMNPNSTTNSLTTRIIFGKEKKPKLVYVDLKTGEFSDPEYKTEYINAFPEYSWEQGSDFKWHNMYRGVDLSLGGYVYAEEGISGNDALLDVESLHPHSVIAMNCFGEHTQQFADILHARLYIKHGEYEAARHMLDGKLAPYLEDESTAANLSQALKIAINSVYGLTAAKFDNPFRDERNVNNIVALRGALFIKTLQDEIVKRGFRVIHCKTDSLKVENATPEIIQFCMDFAKEYGYTFEHEATYEKMCLVDKAQYIAKYKSVEDCEKLYGYAPKKNRKAEEKGAMWTATGKQFAVPYVYKTLFSHEPITFEDMCETFAASKGSLYLDMNEDLPDVSAEEKALDKLATKMKHGKLSDRTWEKEASELEAKIEKGHNYMFIGRVGQFCPMKAGSHGGILYRYQDGKYYAASGTTGYRWLESEHVRILGKQDQIDDRFYRKLVDDSVEAISKYGDFEWFASDEPYIPDKKRDLSDFMNIPIDADEEVPFNEDELPFE